MEKRDIWVCFLVQPTLLEHFTWSLTTAWWGEQKRYHFSQFLIQESEPETRPHGLTSGGWDPSHGWDPSQSPGARLAVFSKPDSVLWMASHLCFPQLFLHFGVLLLYFCFCCLPCLTSLSTQMDSMVQHFNHSLVHSIKAYENTSYRCKFRRHQTSIPHCSFTNLGIASLSIACSWILRP